MTKSNNSSLAIILTWTPVFLWMGVIFTFSSIPTFPTNGIIWWDFILKKSAHIIEYGVLFALLFRALNQTKNKQDFNLEFAIYCLTFCILYAISDEYHQSFTPGRTPNIRDVGFDTIGILISLCIIKSKKIKLLNKFIYSKD